MVVDCPLFVFKSFYEHVWRVVGGDDKASFDVDLAPLVCGVLYLYEFHYIILPFGSSVTLPYSLRADLRKENLVTKRPLQYIE